MQNNNETQWDKILKIRTSGRDASHADQFHYPYEPTPYSVLTRLAESGYINRKSILIDYGCGKGRVGFYLNYELKCRTIGIEYDERLYRKAMENKSTYVKERNVEFICGNAEEYEIYEADCFYFFNPFSIEVMKSVMGQITKSYYAAPRNMLLFFYYPNDEYLSYLMTVDELTFLDEIDCRDLFDGENARERILIFEIAAYE